MYRTSAPVASPLDWVTSVVGVVASLDVLRRFLLCLPLAAAPIAACMPYSPGSFKSAALVFPPERTSRGCLDIAIQAVEGAAQDQRPRKVAPEVQMVAFGLIEVGDQVELAELEIALVAGLDQVEPVLAFPDESACFCDVYTDALVVVQVHDTALTLYPEASWREVESRLLELLRRQPESRPYVLGITANAVLPGWVRPPPALRWNCTTARPSAVVRDDSGRQA